MIEQPSLGEIKQPKGKKARDVAHKALEQITYSPFIEEIERHKPPKKFDALRFTLNDGKPNPISHVRHYKHVMTI